MRAPGRASLKKIAFSIIACCIFLIGLEMISRVALSFIYKDKDKYKLYSDFFPQHAMYMEDGYLFWKGRPNWKGYWWDGIEVSMNSFGLRDKEFPRHKGGNVYRILSLGESGTFGAKLAIEDTYNKLLEHLLSNHNDNSKLTFQVINAGQCSYTSYQGLLYLEKYGLNLEPDLIMTYFESNDRLPSYFVLSSKEAGFWDLFDYRKVGPGMTDRQLFRNRQKFFQLVTALNKSAFYRSLSGLILHIKTSFVFQARKKEVIKEENSTMVKRTERVPEEDRKWIYSRLITIANRRNIKLLILIPPYVPYIYKDDKHDPFPWINQNENVFILDLGKVFKASPYNHDQLFLDGVHPTQLGSKIIAESIFDFLSNHIPRDFEKI